MSPYTTKLATLRLAALDALEDALASADTPAEKRRVAVAILKAPDLEEDESTPVENEPSENEPDARARAATSCARRANPQADTNNLPPQDSGPRTQDSSLPPPDLRHILDHLTSLELDAHRPLPRAISLLAAAGRPNSRATPILHATRAPPHR